MKISFKKGFLIFLFSFAFFSLANFLIAKPASAQYFCETNGWGFGEFNDMDWISFSCANLPPAACCKDESGMYCCATEDCSDCPDCRACFDSTSKLDECVGPTCCEWNEWQSYGVKIRNDGTFTDWAYDLNGFWINFEPTETPPGASGPSPARLHTDSSDPLYFQVTGWAHIWGWDGEDDPGWINLNCENDNSCNDPIYDLNGVQVGVVGDYLKVYYEDCQFKGWGYSSILGWISFNCSNYCDSLLGGCSYNCSEPPSGSYPASYNKVKCGIPPEELDAEVYRDPDNPCRIVRLEWNAPEQGGITYNIWRNGVLLVGLYPIELGQDCPEGKNCIICSDGRCRYNDWQDSPREAGMNPPTPQTSYIYRIQACGCGCEITDPFPLRTTLCNPVLTVGSNCCDNSIIDLRWTMAEGVSGGEGAEGYLIYQAIGGQKYQKVVTSSVYDLENDTWTWSSDSINPYSYSSPIFCPEGFSCPLDEYGNTQYCWCSPQDVSTTVVEDPFVFIPNTHYYYFVRALDSTNPGVYVDSNRIEICCKSSTDMYSLNISIVGSGSVTKEPNSTSYADGTAVTLTPVPESTCIFSDWSGDLTGNDDPATITMDGNKNVTATFICP